VISTIPISLREVAKDDKKTGLTGFDGGVLTGLIRLLFGCQYAISELESNCRDSIGALTGIILGKGFVGND
jgi:hypothetical protein